LHLENIVSASSMISFMKRATIKQEQVEKSRSH
jgi:hypothetical protein